VFTASICVKAVLLLFEPQSKRSFLRQPYRNYAPETTSGVLNRSIFFWLNSLFHKGYRGVLASDDMMIDDELSKSGQLCIELRASWNQ